MNYVNRYIQGCNKFISGLKAIKESFKKDEILQEIPLEISERLNSQYNKLTLEVPLIEDVNRYFESAVYYMKDKDEQMQAQKLANVVTRLKIPEDYARKLLFSSKKYLSIKITDWCDNLDWKGIKSRIFNIEVKAEVPQEHEGLAKYTIVYGVNTCNYKLSLKI